MGVAMNVLPKLKSETTRKIAAGAFIYVWILLAMAAHWFIFFPEYHVALIYAVPIAVAAVFLDPPVAMFFIGLVLLGHSFDSFVLDKVPMVTWAMQTILLLIVSFVTIRGKQQENIERRLAKELEATIDSIAEGLIIYSPDGSVARMNEGAERILGYSAEDFRKPLVSRLLALHVETTEGIPIPPEQTGPMRALRGDTVRGEVQVLHPPTGKSVWVSISAAPIRTSSGRLLGAVVTLTDITAMHQLQEESEDFVRTVSHDLRAPLTVIQGRAQILQRVLEGYKLKEGEGVNLSANF